MPEKINLHLIGISAGAMADYELCNFLKSFDPKKYNIHLTLLDPLLYLDLTLNMVYIHLVLQLIFVNSI